MISKWERFNMEEKIIAVLSDSKYKTKHHFRRPFLTPYQIAIELVIRHPTILNDLGKQLGGQGTGEKTSLAQYIAGGLSLRIKKGQAKKIEGAFLANDNLKEYVFYGPDGSEISSSNRGKEFLSLFRLKS